MSTKSLKQNFIYNIVYQIFAIVLPLITTPYIARVIGPEGSGIHSYTYSIANYFVIFAMLGIANYGNRLIAKNRDNNEKLNYEFTSLFILHCLISIIVILAYIIFIFFIVSEFKIYFLVQGLFVLSSLFDISWLFFGLEEFKTTVTRNIIIRLVALISVFSFVKTSEDLIKYIIILQGSTLLSQVVLFAFLRKNKIRFIKVKYKDIIKHLKPMLVLFIPVVALSVYKMIDKIMLANMINVTEVGFYEYGERIINIPMAVITALGTVMLPRMSNLVSNGDMENVKKYIYKSVKIVQFLSCAMCIGIIIVSKDFIPLFLGNKYEPTISIVNLLAVTIPVIALANVIRTQFLIPKEMDKEFIKSLLIGAIINFILNLFLIAYFKAVGACVATIFAEIFVMLYQVLLVKKYLPTKKYFKQLFTFLIKSIVMGTLIYVINLCLPDNRLLRIIIDIILGVLLYFILNVKFVFCEINFKQILNSIKGKELKRNESKND